jgi:hypothetical protein
MTNSVTKTKVSQSMGRNSRPLFPVAGSGEAGDGGLKECLVSIRRVGSVAGGPHGGGTHADWPERLLVERGEVWFVDAKLESQEAQTFAVG